MDPVSKDTSWAAVLPKLPTLSKPNAQRKFSFAQFNQPTAHGTLWSQEGIALSIDREMFELWRASKFRGFIEAELIIEPDHVGPQIWTATRHGGAPRL